MEAKKSRFSSPGEATIEEEASAIGEEAAHSEIVEAIRTDQATTEIVLLAVTSEIDPEAASTVVRKVT